MAVACAWFVRSAEMGNIEGMIRVAGMYREGIGVVQDIAIAIRWLEEAVKDGKTPASRRAVNDLAWVLATCPDERYRDIKRALKLGESLVSLGLTEPSNLDTLAAAYAVNGDFEKAIHVQQEALEKLGDTGEKELVAPLRERLELYKQGRVWVDP
jgi:TPR repeat protein